MDSKKEITEKEKLDKLLLGGKKLRHEEQIFSPEALETLKNYLKHLDNFPLYTHGRLGVRSFLKKLRLVFPKEEFTRTGLETWIHKHQKKEGDFNE